jgi:hypothetical protein
MPNTNNKIPIVSLNKSDICSNTEHPIPSKEIKPSSQNIRQTRCAISLINRPNHVAIAIFLPHFFYRDVSAMIFLPHFFCRTFFSALFLPRFFCRDFFVALFLPHFFCCSFPPALFMPQFSYHNFLYQ